jgi:hypothetical protein
MDVTPPAPACGKVVFEVGVAAEGGDALERRGGKRRAAEVGVEDDAGGGCGSRPSR